MEVLLVLCKWLQYAAAMILFGGNLFRCLLDDRAVIIDTRLVVWLRCAIGLACLSAIGWLLLEAASMGAGWADAMNPAMVMDVLRGTEFGRVWMVRLVLALFLMVVAVSPPSRLAYRYGVFFSGLFLVSIGLTGHAAMDEGAARVFHPLNQMVHLLAAGSWVGAMLPLWLVLLTKEEHLDGSLALHSVRSFARLGYVAVALVLVSGIVNSWFLLNGLSDFFATFYGRVLVVKLICVAVMLGCAVINRFQFAPALTRTPVARHYLMVSIAVESAFAAAVLVAASYLGNLPPPS